MKERYGVESNGIKVYVTHLPNRRKACLCVEVDNMIRPVASFISDGQAEWFLSVMSEFFKDKLI